MRQNLSETIELIPTYNEKESIALLAEAIFGAYPESSVMVLDDNSPDGTAEVVEKLKNKFTNLHLHKREGERGFGRSYIEGFKKVLGDGKYQNMVMMDADFSHDPKEINAMISKLSDYDVVNGSRYVKGGGIKNWNWRRRFLSRFANFYARAILSADISDLTTGFVCLKKDILRKINMDEISSDGYAFLVELKYRLSKAGAKFYEHPIIYNERREGSSKMSGKIIWESIWLPWRLRFGRILSIL